MMKCKDASHLVASGAAAELGFLKRLELRLHLAVCRRCAAYARRIRTLGAGMRKLAGIDEPSNAELENLEHRICDHLGR